MGKEPPGKVLRARPRLTQDSNFLHSRASIRREPLRQPEPPLLGETRATSSLPPTRTDARSVRLVPSVGQTANWTCTGAASSASRDEWPDAVARDGFGEAMRLALGDDDVSVMEEPVDSCRGESSRQYRVEPRRMQVRGDALHSGAASSLSPHSAPPFSPPPPPRVAWPRRSGGASAAHRRMTSGSGWASPGPHR